MVQEDASFLSWTATLHPETAVATLAPHALRDNRNPLEVVYHEVRSSDDPCEELPVAVNVVAVVDDEHDDRHPNGAESISRPMPWRHSGTVDLILGFMFTFVALLTTFKIELVAFLIYAVAALFHLTSERFFGHPATLLFKSIFGLVSAALMIADSVLLMVNVLITEILGGVALLLCTFFGGPRSGTEWHRFIRRTCHLTRWGIRRCTTTGWKPERIFPISESLESASLQPSSRPSQQGRDSYDRIGYSEELQTHGNDDWDLNGGDDATMSTLTTATVLPSELPPVAVAAEHVHVLECGANDHDDASTDGYFTKNTQEVTID